MEVTLPVFGGQESVGSMQVGYPFTAGTDVTQTLVASDGLQAVEYVKVGTFSVNAAATGEQTDAITFAHAFPNACDAVVFGLTSLGTTTAVINGGPVAASVTAAGFTATVDVTTAGTGNVTGYYVAFGH